MKFRIQCDFADPKLKGKPWWEEYEKPITDPEKWGKEIVQWFNDGRTQGERERVFIKAEILDADAVREHSWGKTNLVTIMHAGKIYDKQKCSVCGILGIRHGLGSINRMGKYKAKVYERCDTALAHLNKKKEKDPA